jgi:hypothetical protein
VRKNEEEEEEREREREEVYIEREKEKERERDGGRESLFRPTPLNPFKAGFTLLRTV